jgi:hypothetical protein
LLAKQPEAKSAGRPTYSHFLCYAKNPPTPPVSPYISGRRKKKTKSKIEKTSNDTDINIDRKDFTVDDDERGVDCEVDDDGEAVIGYDRLSTHLVKHRTSHFMVPDIFYRGEMLWGRGIGLDCCYVGVMFLREIAKCHTVFDPFVGQGTVMAMANALGMKAIGVEISRKRCKKAFSVRLSDEMLATMISPSLRKIELDIVGERRRFRDDQQNILAMESTSNANVY